MNHEIFKYLKRFSTNPNHVDRLIVSAFLKINNISVKNNKFIQTFIITKKDESAYLNDFISVIKHHITTLKIEQLIELFEFVISPSDRVINGAIYTPQNIREYITKKSLQTRKTPLNTVKISDISCGCGGFLLTAAKQLKKATKKSYSDIFKSNIHGLDIQDYSTTRARILLSLLAISEGEDEKTFKFNLFVGDALTFKWSHYLNDFEGFDMVLGNPPYVSARNLSEKTKLNLKNWKVCNSGNPDLYIPFFQIGIECLATKGILAYITMNSFFKSLNGRDLREYFKDNKLKIKIIDFGSTQIFKSKNTYTCICFIENLRENFVKYHKCSNRELPHRESLFNTVDYSNLDSRKGWNLHEHEKVSRIEATGIPFGKLFNTSHGLATLKNDIYIFKPIDEDASYYYLKSGKTYPIEKAICRDIVNSNKLSRAVTLDEIKEKIIFPYDNTIKPKILDESFVKEKYPKAFLYLEDKKNILSLRDKGKGQYKSWFAFGRSQALQKIENKLFFPKYSDRIPSYIINFDTDLLFYNGQAVIGHTEKEMRLIKKIMESRIFWYYIETTSKPYSSGYYSLNGNYIRNFGVCSLSHSELDFVLQENNREVLDAFFEKKYGVNLSDKARLA